MGEIHDDDELALLNTKLFEQQKRTKELSDKIMQMKIKYRQLLEANTKSSLKKSHCSLLLCKYYSRK